MHFKLDTTKKIVSLARNRGLVAKREDLQPRGRGFEF